MNRNVTRLSIACAATLGFLPLQAHAVRIDYAIDAGIERNDNILMSSAAPESSTALRAGLGFMLSQDTSTVQANFGGRFDYWNYVDGPQTNALETSLVGRLNWFIVPETLSFTIEDSLEMRPIDRFVPNTADNRQRVNVLSLGPNVQFNFSRTFRGRFELRWIDSNAEVTDELESQRFSAALHAIRDFDSTSSLTFSLRGQDVDFERNVSIEDYRRYDATVRYQKELSRIAFGLEAGNSWVDFADGRSSSHPMARADIGWRMDDRHSLAASVARQLSDSTMAALAGIAPTGEVPEQMFGGSSAISGSIYKEDRADLSYSFDGERFSFSAGPYYQRIEYLDSLAFDETRRGMLLEASYRLAPTWNLRGFIDESRSTFPGLDRRTEDRRTGLSLDKTWARHWSSSLQYMRYERDTSPIPDDSRQNVWYLTVIYRNR